MQNAIIHHREADRYAKDKYIAKRKLLSAETFEEFKEAKRRYEITQQAQSAVITLRDNLLAELKGRRTNIDKSVTVLAFNALNKREITEATLARKVSKVTKEAREIGADRYKGVDTDVRSNRNLWDSKSISYAGRRSGKARFVAKEPLKEFFATHGLGVRG